MSKSDAYIRVECDNCHDTIEIELTTTARGYDERNVDAELCSQGWRDEVRLRQAIRTGQQLAVVPTERCLSQLKVADHALLDAGQRGQIFLGEATVLAERLEVRPRLVELSIRGMRGIDKPHPPIYNQYRSQLIDERRR